MNTKTLIFTPIRGNISISIRRSSSHSSGVRKIRFVLGSGSFVGDGDAVQASAVCGLLCGRRC